MRVLLADDQRVVREGLETILGSIEGFEVVASCANGAEAVKAAAELDPDVVLMDLRMPEMDGVEATAAIKASGSRASVVVLTTYADDDSIVSALEAGAVGYLTKEASRQDIRRAIEGAAAGQGVLDKEVQARLLAAVSSAQSRKPATTEPSDGLTEREIEVLALIAGGLSNGEIAERLFVSESTVKSHVNHIFAKTNSRDRAQATAYAYKSGIAQAGS